MISSRHEFTAGNRTGRDPLATARIVATLVHGYAVIVEMLSSLGLPLAGWAIGPRLSTAVVRTRGR